MAKPMESVYVHVTERLTGRPRRFTKFIWDRMKPAIREQYEIAGNGVPAETAETVEYKQLVQRAKGLEKDKNYTGAAALTKRAAKLKNGVVASTVETIDVAVVEADKAYDGGDFVVALELYEAAADPLNGHVIDRITELSKNAKK